MSISSNVVHTEMHQKVRGPGYLFWVWHVLRDYAHLLKQGETPLPDLERLMAIAAVLEKDAGEPHICICHSDLLAANFIDDGHKLWLIDWEYGAFGNVWFDMGNMAAISDFDRQEETQLFGILSGSSGDRDRMAAFRRHAVCRKPAGDTVGHGVGTASRVGYRLPGVYRRTIGRIRKKLHRLSTALPGIEAAAAV